MVIDLLARMVRYDTRTNRGQIGREVKDLLEHVVAPILIDNQFEIEYFESNGHWSLLGKRYGGPTRFFLSGHVDVVPWIRELWNTDPNVLEQKVYAQEQVVIGRGVSDMLSGVAAILKAISKYPEDVSVYIGITGDEEVGGENGTGVIIQALEERGELPHYVITGDASGMAIINRRRNIFDIEFRVNSSKQMIRGVLRERRFESNITTETSHAAYFNKETDLHCMKLMADFIESGDIHPIAVDGQFVKVNAIPPSVTLVYVEEDDSGELLEFDLGLSDIIKIAGRIMDLDIPMEKPSSYGLNITSNVLTMVDDVWDLQVDIRAMISEQSTVIEELVEQLINTINPEIHYKIFKSVGYVYTDPSSPLINAAAAILDELGYSGIPEERGGATDGRFFGQHSIPCIDIGAIGAFDHGPNERATISSIHDLVSFFEQIIPQVIKQG